MSFEFTKSVSTTSTFTQTTGVTVGVSVSAKVDIPFVGDSEVEVSTEVSQDWEYGSENQVAFTFEADSPLVVPAGAVYEAIATCKQTQMDIPYTGIVYYVGTSVTKTVSGTYTGVDLYELETTISVLA